MSTSFSSVVSKIFNVQMFTTKHIVFFILLFIAIKTMTAYQDFERGNFIIQLRCLQDTVWDNSKK